MCCDPELQMHLSTNFVAVICAEIDVCAPAGADNGGRATAAVDAAAAGVAGARRAVDTAGVAAAFVYAHQSIPL